MFSKISKSLSGALNQTKIPKKYAIPLITAAGCAFAGAAVESNFKLIEKLKNASEQVYETVKINKAEPKSVDNSEKLTVPLKEEGNYEDLKSFLPYLSDKVFETTDDMLVFTFPSEDQYLQQLSTVKTVIAAVNKADIPRVKMFFVILPARDPSLVSSDRLEMMCYKGQRKKRFSISLNDAPIPVDEWREFYKFKASPVEEELKDCIIEHISGSDFDEKIIKAPQPVLLQLYEKSCFLCFLMRPFLNSLAHILKESGEVDFSMKRLDIEENDFPEGLPVVRGTPTFMLFRNGVPDRLEEFKPRDLVNRLCRDYTLSSETQERMKDLVDLMALRFQAFSALVMWGTESEKMLALLTDPQTTCSSSNEDSDKEMFNKLVAEFMTEDMLKIDSLKENIQSLLRELASMERHAIKMAQVLGEKVASLE